MEISLGAVLQEKSLTKKQNKIQDLTGKERTGIMKIGQTVIFSPQNPKAYQKKHIRKPFTVLRVYDDGLINIVSMTETWQTICRKSDLIVEA